jgi:hypothetical protein
LTVAVLSGCGRAGCGAGASSATDAVRGVLTGLATDSDEEICRFVPEDSAQQARSSLAELAGAVASAGGVDSVRIVEATDRRMGSERVVRIVSGEAALADVVVIEQEGAYLVLPGIEPTVD